RGRSFGAASWLAAETTRTDPTMTPADRVPDFGRTDCAIDGSSARKRPSAVQPTNPVRAAMLKLVRMGPGTDGHVGRHRCRVKGRCSGIRAISTITIAIAATMMMKGRIRGTALNSARTPARIGPRPEPRTNEIVAKVEPSQTLRAGEASTIRA